AQQGAPEEVYRRPETEFVARFLGECNLLPATIVGENGGRVELASDAVGCFAARRDHVSRRLGDAACLAAIRPENVRLGPSGSGRLRGVVEERSYLGARTRYLVATGRTSFIVISDERDAMAAGTEVGIDWDDEAVALVAPAVPNGREGSGA
ncbi:MAG TPA: TOBE domain-containing protein, partial [Thermomicrobiales bacterium]|nr:TOBE domain-containing protein [Thermomicrobiales bacterium]